MIFDILTFIMWNRLIAIRWLYKTVYRQTHTVPWVFIIRSTQASLFSPMGYLKGNGKDLTDDTVYANVCPSHVLTVMSTNEKEWR